MESNERENWQELMKDALSEAGSGKAISAEEFSDLVRFLGDDESRRRIVAQKRVGFGYAHDPAVHYFNKDLLRLFLLLGVRGFNYQEGELTEEVVKLWERCEMVYEQLIGDIYLLLAADDDVCYWPVDGLANFYNTFAKVADEVNQWEFLTEEGVDWGNKVKSWADERSRMVS